MGPLSTNRRSRHVCVARGGRICKAVKRGQVVIPVPLEIAPKIALVQAMRERKVSNTALARELNITETVVRRMLNPKHKSKPDQYTRTLLAMGCAVEVSIVPVAR